MAPWILLVGMTLDALLGEPSWLWSRLPHPAVMMGRVVGWCDRTLNNNTTGAGLFAVIGLTLGALGLGWGLSLLGPSAEILIVAILLAQRSLVQHVSVVARDLRISLISARRSVSMIVSRNTSDMSSHDTARAAIESGAENLSDGVIAPAFWTLIGGLPALILYKVINTADSMIGYRTPQHENFGWAAARFDDVLNWVPARLTAGLLWLVGGGVGRWSDIRAEAKRHKSPNAGWPEAVLARTLNISLAGPRKYHGETQDLPWVNPTGRRNINASEIEKAVDQLWRVWWLFAMVLVIFSLVTLLS